MPVSLSINMILHALKNGPYFPMLHCEGYLICCSIFFCTPSSLCLRRDKVSWLSQTPDKIAGKFDTEMLYNSLVHVQGLQAYALLQVSPGIQLFKIVYFLFDSPHDSPLSRSSSESGLL